MSIAFVLLVWILLLMTPLAIEFVALIGVGGCLCLICFKDETADTRSFAMMYSALNSALVAKVITFVVDLCDV